MSKLNTGKVSLYVLTAVFAVSAFLLGKLLTTSVLAIPAGDVAKAYCHAAGQSGTLKFNYHFNKAWTAHFLDNGTPRAGHESDFYTVIGDKNCDGQPDATPTPTASPTPTATPFCDVETQDCSTPTPSPTATPVEDDACPNLDGFQDSVPAGYIVDNADNCVPEPTPTPNGDLCQNIDGIQTSVPDGLHLSGAYNNQCVAFSQAGVENPTGPAQPQGQVLGASTMAKTGSFDEALYLAIMGLGGIITSIGAKKAFKKA